MFGIKNFTKQEIEGKRVLEVGSYDYHGSLRPVIQLFSPIEYLGVDIKKGPGVDIICNAEDILKKFGNNSFDVVLSTELLEHVKDWRTVISNIKNICRPEGTILLTTRSKGFPYHGHPYDFWRYEVEDMKNIFEDCIIERLEIDKELPGVFIKLKKPANFKEKDLSGYELFSIISNKKMKEVDEKALQSFQKRYLKHDKIKKNVIKIANFFYSKILSSL